MLEKEKKFLDQKGVEYLWSKINMQDYPNNDTLIAVINAIDEGKMDKNTAIPLIEQAIAGQVPVVKSVDENGKPIEWEVSELLPKTKKPNKQLVSDSNKVIKWEDRTHYIHREPIVILPEIYIENKKSAVVTEYANYEQTFKAGQLYNIIYNGKEYQSTAWFKESMYTTCLGNESLTGTGEDSGEPFFFNTSEVPQMSFVYFSTQGNHTISINSGYNETYVPLDEKYLPTTVPVIDAAQAGQIPIITETQDNRPKTWSTAKLPTKTSDLENDANFATQTEITTLQSAIDTLNGIGEGSVRDIVADSVATIVANAPEDFDTLKEVADWISNDTLGTADLLQRMTTAEEKIVALDIQADWNQTDESAKDFIKNKPNENDALALLAETGFIDPVTAVDGSVFTDSNGVLYTL